MTYAEAMRRYGSDKPDLRVKLQFTELTDVMKDVDFKVFSGAGQPCEGGRVVALRVPGGAEMTAARSTPTPSSSRSTAPRAWPTSRSTTPAKGRDGLQSPIVKNLHDAALAEILIAHRRATAT
jgi:aspartyl-tRNA synthetase